MADSSPNQTKIIRLSKVSSSNLATYNGGPLWQNGYKWINVYWGSYWKGTNLPLSPLKIDNAVKNIEADAGFSGGLIEYNVGQGVLAGSFIIPQDPPSSIDNSAIGPALKSWITSNLIPDVMEKGAYNIFFPPGVSITLNGSASCAVFCDFHFFWNDGTKNYYYTIEPYPCATGCNHCTSDPFDALTQGLSEEMAELKTDMQPGSGWVIGNEELCDYCLLPDEMLLGDNKPICEYKVGDSVVGSLGLQKVTKTYKREYHGELIEIRAEGMLPFKVTANHPILSIGESPHEVQNKSKVRYIDSNNHWRNRYHVIQEFASPKWKRADELVEKHSNKAGDCLILSKIKGNLEVNEVPLSPYMKHPHYFTTKKLPNSFPLTKDTAWLLGLYVAEGSTNREHQISFALAEHEIEIQNKARDILNRLGYRCWVRKVKDEKCIILYFNSRPLLKMLEEICGRGAANKRIPDLILYNKNSELLRAFLEGHYVGDGYTNGSYRILVTISIILIQQLQLAYARLGRFLKVRKIRNGGKEIIHNRSVSTLDKYQGELLLSPIRKEFTRTHGESFFVPIRSLKHLRYDGKVYNIGTPDHTYLVANAIVHNCDANFVCNRIPTGEYVNAWYSNKLGRCWKSSDNTPSPNPPPQPSTCPIAKIFTKTYNSFAKIFGRKTRLTAIVPSKVLQLCRNCT